MSGYWTHPVVGYVTNLGNVYCASHNPTEPGVLRKEHAPFTEIRDGWKGTPCDWPGCTATMPQVGMADYVHVDLSLHSNL